MAMPVESVSVFPELTVKPFAKVTAFPESVELPLNATERFAEGKVIVPLLITFPTNVIDHALTEVGLNVAPVATLRLLTVTTWAALMPGLKLTFAELRVSVPFIVALLPVAV